MLNTMGFYLWLMPVLFLVHEFEEIFMIEAWFSRYGERIKSTWPKLMPFGLNNARPHLTATISIAIFFEFILVILVCLVGAIFQNYYAWYGFLAANVIHMLTLHLGNTIKFKGYMPGIITCAITFIPCVWMLYQAAAILHYGVLEVVLSTVGMWLLEGLLTFKVLHKAMASLSKKLEQYSLALIK